jgi:hypothetical protein
MTVELRGCYPILATPFLPDGDIDENSVVRLLRHLMLAELDRFVGRIAGRLHPSTPWPTVEEELHSFERK